MELSIGQGGLLLVNRNVLLIGGNWCDSKARHLERALSVLKIDIKLLSMYFTSFLKNALLSIKNNGGIDIQTADSWLKWLLSSMNQLLMKMWKSVKSSIRGLFQSYFILVS